MKALRFHQGLTMVEVLVALAITAVALLAAGQAMRALTHAAQRQQQVMLAQWCADNALVQLRLHAQYPSIGQTAHTCDQWGQQFDVQVLVSGTANPSFRRVQAKVMQGGYSVLSVSTVLGRY